MKAAKDIKNGKNILIFPEGTRHREGVLQQFKEGAFLLSQKSGVPVIPVTLVGTKDVIRKNSWIAYKADVDVYLGKPIDPSDYSKAERQQMVWDVEDAIAEHLPEEGKQTYYERKQARNAKADG
jgi:1-acyl-sn-glycerol-3-phosphate acyltransferase